MADYQGSIELIGGLTQKNNGKFPLVHVKDVYQPTADALPDGGIAEAGVMYFLGEIAGTLTVGFPDAANTGEAVYISFTTGTTAPVVNFTTTNHAGLGDYAAQANCYCEIVGMWNGVKWVCVTNEVPR